MKNFAKLILFFSLSFTAFFVIAILLKFITSWLDLTRIIPIETRSGENFAEAAWIALPAALYFSILLSLNYSSRRAMSIFTAILGTIILACAFSAGASLGIGRTEALHPVFKPVSPIKAEPGLIVSRGDTSIILLRDNSDVRGPRVVSIPGRPLVYQEVPIGPNNTILPLPAISLGEDFPWFLRSIGIDFTLSAGELKSRFESDYLSFAAYAFSLILFLSSLCFIMELSQWPLANLFIGALVFRSILTLETFLNSREINVLIGSYLDGRVPNVFVTPLVFCTLGILTLLFTLLTRMVRGIGRKSRRSTDG